MKDTNDGGMVKKSTIVYNWNMNTNLSLAAMNLMKKYAINRTLRMKSNFKKVIVKLVRIQIPP